jgi:hypothetical protein
VIEASYVMPNETQNPPGTQAPSRSRRRMLLAATGALPSVLTLSSGAASAANYLACMLNQPNPMPQRFTPGEDNWVRAQVNVAAYENRPAYCITTPSSSCVDGGNNAIPGSTWVVDGNKMTAGIQNNLQVLNQRAYGLVYVDRTGSIMTLDKNSNVYPLQDSCWTSIMGGRTMNLG